MGKFNPKSSTKDFTFPNGVTQHEGLVLVRWAKEYIKVFDDELFERLIKGVLSEKWMKLSTVESIRKKRINIPFKMIKNTDLYSEKFFPVVARLCYLVHSYDNITNEFKKGMSMLDFFLNWKYLTDKQINLIKRLSKPTEDSFLRFEDNLKLFIKNIVSSSFKNVIFNNADIGFLSSEKSLQAFRIHSLMNGVIDKNKEKAQMKIEEKKKKQRKKLIKEGFNSLSSLRKQMEIK